MRFGSRLFPFLVLFVSCMDDGSVKPPSIGRLSEVAVVADSALWHSPAGRSLHAALTAAYPGIPQGEPWFNLSTFSPGHFAGMVRLHRNVVILAADSAAGAPVRLGTRRNAWASPQLVLTVYLPDGKENLLLDSLGLRLVEVLAAEERQRLIETNYRGEPSRGAVRAAEKFGYAIGLPGDYVVARDEPGFLWLRRETSHTSTGILLYATDGASGDPGEVLRRRDSIARLYVPGPQEGSYMVTDTAFALVRETRALAGGQALVLRGLWRLHGDFMGGPFLSATLPRAGSRNGLTAEGFVYAPRFDKRDYMKQVEAIVFSMREP
jgi:hypothetical protein